MSERSSVCYFSGNFLFTFLILASSFIYVLVAQVLWGSANLLAFSVFEGDQIQSEHHGEHRHVSRTSAETKPRCTFSGQAKGPDSCNDCVNILYSK